MNLKNELTNKVIELQPREFYNLFDGEIISDPVITEYGHVFDRTSIRDYLINERETSERKINEREICPFTRQPLKFNELIAGGETLRDILRFFKTDEDLMLNSIRALKSLKNELHIRESLNSYTQRVNQYRQQFIEAIIIQFKNHFLLDINSVEHLKFWEKKAAIGVPTRVVNTNNGPISVSQPIFKLLEVAAQGEYKTQFEFRNAIDKARKTPLSNWNHFWSHLTTTNDIRIIENPDFFKKKLRR